jgi:hypothetical protein
MNQPTTSKTETVSDASLLPRLFVRSVRERLLAYAAIAQRHTRERIDHDELTMTRYVTRRERLRAVVPESSSRPSTSAVNPGTSADHAMNV